MVQAMDVNGNFLNPDTSTVAGMSVATLANLSGLTAPTQNITLPIILPESTNPAETHAIPLVVTDSLGVNHTLTLTFSNPISVVNDIQWTMTITPPAVPELMSFLLPISMRALLPLVFPSPLIRMEHLLL